MTRLAAVLLLVAALSGCTGNPLGTDGPGDGSGGPGVDVSAPEVGACRAIDVAVVEQETDDTEPVACTEPHTAQTFHVGTFAEDAAYDDERLGAQVTDQCRPRFARFTGATPSLAMRSVVTWAWWRPSEEAWEAGARWFRCDVVGGSAASERLVGLPRTAKGLLLGIPAPRWMLCADGATVAQAPRVPCTEPHTWRAVSAVAVGKPKDPWPGSRLVEVRSRDFCSDWVGAWSNYALDYEYAYTWFGKDDWSAGNRLSVCWAKTDE